MTRRVAALVVAWGLLAALGPARLEALPPVCWSRLVFDKTCAGCGLTRGLAHLARGDLAAAKTAHPGTIPLATFALGLFLFGEPRRPRLRPLRRRNLPLR